MALKLPQDLTEVTKSTKYVWYEVEKWDSELEYWVQYDSIFSTKDSAIHVIHQSYNPPGKYRIVRYVKEPIREIEKKEHV